MRTRATIVTAYYPIARSKHGFSKYMEWVRNLCAIPRPMVIFTTPEMAPVFERMRAGVASNATRVIAREFTDFSLTMPARMEMWRRQWHMDPEAAIHSPELYAVWAIKQECVAAAIAANPFGHDWFVWCDAGIQRHPEMQRYYMTFTDAIPALCLPRTIHVLEVQRIPDRLAAIRGECPMPYPPPPVTLGAGCMVGDRAAWAAFSAGYTAMLDKFLVRGWFAGKDQILYFAMLMERTVPFRLFAAVRFGDEARGDPWMSFPVILGGQAPALVDARFEEKELMRSTDSNATRRSCYVQLIGGLGNQLFQIAAGYAHARRTGRRLQLSQYTDCRRSTYWQTFLSRCAKFVVPNPPLAAHRWQEPHFHYREIPHEADMLCGFFQSSRYFKDVSGEIRELFEPDSHIKAVVAAKHAELVAAAAKSCVVHVRRTDFLTAASREIHAVCDKEWYARALAEMDRILPGRRYLVFSDDLEWCRAPEQADLWGEREVVFVEEPNDSVALHLMSKFSAFVISNSTFSWWATWLLPGDKTVVCPASWFGPAGHKDWEDVYEPGWIRVD